MTKYSLEKRVRPLTFLHLSAISLLAISAVGVSIASAAPIVTLLSDGSSSSALALVNGLLGSSPNLSVISGSALYTGAVPASGTFTGGGTGPSGVGIDTGVVLSTGDARFLESSAAFLGDSANQNGTFTSGVGNALTVNNSPGDSLFGTLTSFPTFNASILTFSFVPQGSTLTLRLVFGSEDYNDLVHSGFPTDVFGVFLNGVNYGRVPGTSLPISASSINCGGPTSGPAPNSGGQNCALYRDNPPFFDLIDSEVDGFTVPIDLLIPVNFGAINTLSIGIADNADSFSDSAVLLAARSIAAVSAPVSVPEPSTLVLMLAALLLCAQRHFRFGRPISWCRHDRIGMG